MVTPKSTEETEPKSTAVDTSKLTTITIDGYSFEADTDIIDNVEVLDMLDEIENKNKPAVIIDFLKLLIGDKGYDDLKAYFVEKEGKLRLTKLTQIYTAIFEKFDPKG